MKEQRSPMNVEDHRRYPRKAVKPGYAWLTLSRDGRVYDGHLYDISMGGIRFELDEAVPAGSVVDVHLYLPTGRHGVTTIEARGQVVRYHDPEEVGPIRMGLAFTGMLTAGDAEALSSYLHYDEPTSAVA